MTQLTINNVIVAIEPIEQSPAGHRSDRHERESAAVGRIVDSLLGPGTVIGHHPDGAPFIEGRDDLHISISHSATHAAVSLSRDPLTGIDTETSRDQLERIKTRYLSAAELNRFTTRRELLTAWCIKEAAYKAARISGLDLRDGISIDPDTHTVTAGPHTLTYNDLTARLLPPGLHATTAILLTTRP